ncbi:2-amino-4-hydroxy-6-hydroxymethyldihydropteridine diphosphokinase [Antribacter gilvus]|uniref:2-amino-4-hydroxy-6- hydroxymethyldihydropteridine diphosphokinase n=1 Tax=Antribacter gilvus TaxID=2304675 RepID=UPI0019801FA8|nr:2-amino-4-hydroxy-6-hydroxymethyldihydropteridine diphosphokinase [Antribacter gilvus]
MTIAFGASVPAPDGLPLDQIRLTGVSARGNHGVLPSERATGQEFRADVVLHVDTRAAAAGDRLEDTISYADVAQDVHAVLSGDPADLIETVAERIAAAVLVRPQVHTVDVTVHKPHAPIPVAFSDVEVSIRRDRNRAPVVAAPPLASEQGASDDLQGPAETSPVESSPAGGYGERYADEAYPEQASYAEPAFAEQPVFSEQPAYAEPAYEQPAYAEPAFAEQPAAAERHEQQYEQQPYPEQALYAERPSVQPSFEQQPAQQEDHREESRHEQPRQEEPSAEEYWASVQSPVWEPAAEPAPAEVTGAPEATADAEHEGRPHDRMDEVPAGWVDVVLALGANLGDPQATLRAAVTDLDRVAGLEVTDVSPLARTAAVGGPDQPDFLNTVLLARTTLSARDLLRACQTVEAAHGRVRDERWGPRTLDIDLIVYGTLTATADDLELPHPRAHERAFVLEPWSQVEPDAVLPGLGGGPVAALAATAPDRSGIRWLALDWLTDPESAASDGGGAAPSPAEVPTNTVAPVPATAQAPAQQPHHQQPHHQQPQASAQVAPPAQAPVQQSAVVPMPPVVEPGGHPQGYSSGSVSLPQAFVTGSPAHPQIHTSGPVAPAVPGSVPVSPQGAGDPGLASSGLPTRASQAYPAGGTVPAPQEAFVPAPPAATVAPQPPASSLPQAPPVPMAVRETAHQDVTSEPMSHPGSPVMAPSFAPVTALQATRPSAPQQGAPQQAAPQLAAPQPGTVPQGASQQGLFPPVNQATGQPPVIPLPDGLVTGVPGGPPAAPSGGGSADVVDSLPSWSPVRQDDGRGRDA